MGFDLSRLKVSVVGGSLGGLTTALLLRDAGCDVDVFERSASELSGYGAGVVVHAATVRYFRERTGLGLDAVSVPSSTIRYLDRERGVVLEEPSTYRFTSWSTLYRSMLAIVATEHYHSGEALVAFEQDADGVDVRFASGRTERCDLLVCADGIMSTARRQLLPDVELAYAGYVGWRGTVSEADLSHESAAALDDAITYGVVEHSHVLAYPIPNFNGATESDGRLINFVWYRNVEPGHDLDELMRDRTGVLRSISLHPGEVQERYVTDLRRTAEAVLAEPLAEMVAKAESPFVQVIVDLEVPRIAFGRVALLGDAAFAARPHAAAGTAKAAENAWKLAEALEAGGSVEEALARWEPGQLQLGRRLVARAREMGNRSQVLGTWEPGDPDLRFGLYGPGR